MHPEQHVLERTAWLRAAILGANDGIISTASLLVGVAASGADKLVMALTGVLALIAGAMSMAAGEYVSVSSQADAEKAALAREHQELRQNPEHEHLELVQIYIKRGLDPHLAHQVAEQMMSTDALAAHARDELGIFETRMARPLQAAFASALSFAAGALLPLLLVLFVPTGHVVGVLFVASLLLLALLGATGARIGHAPVLPASLRVGLWGGLAMLLTAGIGEIFQVLA